MAILLWPFSLVYNIGIVLYSLIKKPKSINIPVICIGNLVAGGVGKTPSTIAITKLLQKKGLHVHLLSRGYRGKLQGPIQVNLNHHTALEVGDEPLLLARHAPTWVAKNRLEGALAAQKAGAEVILLDDGMQNLDLKKDFTVLIFDQTRGFGNRYLLPAGPLREPIHKGLKKAHAVFLTNTKVNEDPEVHSLKKQAMFQVHTQPCAADIEVLHNQKLIAFSGIGYPQKFYITLQEAGLQVIKTLDFDDHHHFTTKELNKLWQTAQKSTATLVTTEKDWVRLDRLWRQKIHCVRIESTIDQAARFIAQIEPILKKVQQ